MTNENSDLRVTWQEAFKVALTIYLPLRVGLSLFAAGVVWLLPDLALPLRTNLMLRWGFSPPEGFAAEVLLNPWLRFDALWYIKIAVGGYDMSEMNMHHFPLFPILLWLFAQITGSHLALAGVVVSNLAFVAALAYFYRLVRLDYASIIGWRATFYLAIFPTAFFYLIGYTESLFLLGSVTAFYHARQRTWGRSGLWGSGSALARPQGVLIFLPLAVEFLFQEKRQLKQRWFKAWPLLFIPLAVGLYAVYIQTQFGLRAALDADMAYWQMRSVWLPGLALWLNLQAVWRGVHVVNNSLDLLFALFGLAMTGWAIKDLRPSYWMFMAFNLLLLLSRPVAEYPLISLPRMVLPLFPIFILLGRVGYKSPVWHRVIVYLSLALLLLFSGQFVLGGWIA